MAKTEPFEKHLERYELWFEEHRFAYLSELRALRSLLPDFERGVEIGIGTARFAAPLGVGYGVEPARAAHPVARRRGVRVICGLAESLPLRTASFDLALMVTTICFVDDVPGTLAEARRILTPKGHILLGFVDRASPLGALYEKKRHDNPFYRIAQFYSADEVIDLLTEAGFRGLAIRQTLFERPDLLARVDEVRDGFGEGGFVAIRALR